MYEYTYKFLRFKQEMVCQETKSLVLMNLENWVNLINDEISENYMKISKYQNPLHNLLLVV